MLNKFYRDKYNFFSMFLKYLLVILIFYNKIFTIQNQTNIDKGI